MIEAARNLACVGAVPQALVNCLNFGNPEHPEVMWQFAEVVDGMSEACRALGIPVVGGNVSFYNESRGRDIDPTPVVGVVGLIDAARPPCRRRPSCTTVTRVVVLGHTAPELGGSEWADLHGLRGGTPPAADLDAAARAARLRARPGRPSAWSRGVHDCSDGGLAVTAGRDGDRRRVRVRGSRSRSELVPALAWFSESASRVVVAVDPAGVDALVERARAAGVPAPTPRHRRRRPARGRRRLRRRARRRHRRLARRHPGRPRPIRRPTGSIGRESTPWNGG